MNENEQMIPRKTLTQLVNSWTEATAEIRQAFGLLVTAEKRLKENFKPDSYLFSLDRSNREYRDYADPERLIKELKKDAWKALIDRMDLRRVISIKKAKELDKQLETGEGLPEIDETQILDMLTGTMEQLDSFMEAAVKEVFDILRPTGWCCSNYKTNEKSKFEGVGRKIILTWYVRHSYSGRGFQINYYKQDELRALDNVFHLLDGAGQAKTWRGDLIDAIEDKTNETGVGETQYFKFKCYGNGNLHLEFKRLDLVAKLNAVAGGMRLRESKEAA